MGKTIFKYELELSKDAVEQGIMMPSRGEILDVQMQPGQGLVFWAKVDPTEPPVLRTFVVFSTGQRLPDDDGLDYLATLQVMALTDQGPASFVFHLFEKRGRAS